MMQTIVTVIVIAILLNFVTDIIDNMLYNK